MLKYIQNWNNKNLACTFCGGKKSVKYAACVKDVDGNDVEVPMCNNPNCVVHYMRLKEELNKGENK